MIATDPSGAARSGTNVHVELQRATYASATQIVEGAEAAGAVGVVRDGRERAT